jgi:pimeloyl-ACP methyl ester carboxylesterase
VKHRAAIFLVFLCAVTGCTSGISVQQVGESPLLADWYASAVGDELSPRTQQTLRQLDLASRYQDHPQAAFHDLQELAVRGPRPDYLFALAEIAYHLGQSAERRDERAAVAYYYLCAGYAYHYLFGGEAEKEAPASGRRLSAGRAPSQLADACRSPAAAFDPRFRVACDLYNRGLAKCLRVAQRNGRLDPRQALHIPVLDGRDITLTVTHHGFAWRPEEFGPLLFCADYRVIGLANQYHSYGLGVPLIGIRAAANESAPGQAFYPQQVSFPVTAFFPFSGSLADLGAGQTGRLELYNPLTIHQVQVAGQPTPLETDLTTPLAYFLSHTDLGSREYAGFFRADALQDRTGIYLFEPYQPGKIPVLMIHGLLSSPLTWAPLFNDLRADPELNAHYQFWFFRYPTGNPYLLSAAQLRQALDRLRDQLDPHHEDDAFDRMVLVGHSMGGLIAKLLTQDSGDDFWRLVSKQPFTQLKAKPQERQQIEQVFFFHQEPGVQRVIFLATPHHGSKLLGRSPLVRLIDKLVRPPARVQQVAADLSREDPGLWAKANGEHRIPTSLDLLSPGAPALELLAARSAPPGVVYHSIIGVSCGRVPTGSDGIVPYRSAHIEGVESEVIVPADHTHVQGHPRTVLEVRRILYEHLRWPSGRLDPAVVPAGAGLRGGPS